MANLAMSESAAPVFREVVSLDALTEEFRHFAANIQNLSPEELAIRAAWSVGIIVGAVAILWLLRYCLRLIARWLSPKRDKHSDEAKVARRSVGDMTMVAARFVIGMFALGAVFFTWGFDVRTGALGNVLLVIWRAGIIILVALAAVELCGFAINRMVSSGAKRSSSARRAAQLRTLAPLIQGIATSIVALVALMMTLSQFGLDVGPLIAGAGIFGLAFGFGAQTLVKDFLTGIFLILEDTVSVGDIVGIGDFGGVVEEMSLRTIKLRDYDGTLRVFPYSEAQVIHNRTKLFSYAVFELEISYSSDIDKAFALLESTSQAMMADEAFKDFILSPIDIAGVDRLDSSGVILKARIKTAPGKQWSVQRAFLQRIKSAFDGAGIDIPFPHLKLVSPDAPIPFGDRHAESS
ncbi:MAG: mechanosensitive ion channel family protein [Hyphomonadaceae bacterium]|nr:mechanosensitive ion channel family protein [Hyphomonadaceae bacterium]